MAAKTIRTKPFLLATAGSTVDGRTIDEKMLKEMASSYDPKTYGARVNIEHIRGISPDAPFNAYGDLAELTTAEVEVNFNGKPEKRLGLFGSFDLLESAKLLNEKGQKVYPSIEIADNFGGKGYAYCMGVALTDSPASIATERLQFNRRDPGRIGLSSDEAALVEFVEEKTGSTDGADGFFSKLSGLLDQFTGKPKDEPKPEAKPEGAQGFDTAAFAALMKGFGETFSEQLQAARLESEKQIETITAQVTALSAKLEGTPAPGHESRPLATGATATFAKTDC